MMSVKDSVLNKRLDCTFSKKCATAFHKQVLESWTNVYHSETVNGNDIVSEFILCNKYITVTKKTISIDRLPNNLSYNVKIIDILDDTGEFLKRTVLNEKLGSNMS